MRRNYLWEKWVQNIIKLGASNQHATYAVWAITNDSYATQREREKVRNTTLSKNGQIDTKDAQIKVHCVMTICNNQRTNLDTREFLQIQRAAAVSETRRLAGLRGAQVVVRRNFMVRFLAPERRHAPHDGFLQQGGMGRVLRLSEPDQPHRRRTHAWTLRIHVQYDLLVRTVPRDPHDH